MKKEQIKNELRAIISAGAAYLQLRQERKEQFRKDAGIILAHEAQDIKNRRAQISVNADLAKRDIIKSSGVISSCCGSACLRNYKGEIICADCLSSCTAMEIEK